MRYDLAQYNKQLFSLTIPLVVEQVLRISMSNVNIFLLGRYSDAAVASVGVANQYVNLGQMLLTLAATGAAVVISQYIGADDRKRANMSAQVTLLISFAMSLIICPLLIFFAQPLLGLAGIGAELLPDAIIFMRIVGGTLFVHGAFSAFSAMCRCFGFPRLPMYGIILMNVLNFTGTFITVQMSKTHVFDVVMTIAWINALSAFAGLALLVFFVVRYVGISFSPALLRPFPFRLVREVLNIGLPSGMESVSYNVMQIVTTNMISGLGVVVLSAKAYLSSVTAYTYILGMCFGQANQLIVAQLTAAGKLDEASALVKRNFRINLTMNLCVALVVFILRKPIFGLFTNSAAVIALAGGVLLIDILVECGRALGHCFNLALRSVGDVRFTMSMMLASTWLLCVPLCYLLAVRLDLGLYGIWIAFVADEWLRGGAACFRWCANKWRPRMLARISLLQNS
ncbi:MAG: MATE family efflux transporter [Oscillospiraceae bacterium]|jgi:putative MATE family efflux protein|nr:MATE family efflux transporter [Oscillospiraceae bacterium]